MFLDEYRRASEGGDLQLGPEALADADVQVGSIALQTKSPQPRRKVIKLLLNELHVLLQNSGSAAVWVGLTKLIELLG